MSIQNKDQYFVAVKVFLEHQGKLFIFKDRFGDWDLPGGRITKDEFDIPLEDIIRRKMKEEIGDNVEYSLEKPLVFMRHERVESAPGNPTVRIFAIGYPATLESGEIKLSNQHLEMRWVEPSHFRPEEYFTGGWLKGVQEYLERRLR
ncbi:MAG: NUDIX domain-containing protein [Candidatus Peribacteraceae bacterium]